MRLVISLLAYLLGFVFLLVVPNINHRVLIGLTLLTPIPIIIFGAIWSYNQMKDDKSLSGLGGMVLIMMVFFVLYLVLISLLCFFQNDIQALEIICSILPGI